MGRASWEGLQSLQPERRPYLLSRATFSGGQRFGAVWTGDNCSEWEHLQIANIQCQRLSISGFSFCGTDIGGFTGCTDGELFVRWLQLAVFHPLMRTHSKGEHAGGDFLEEIPSSDSSEFDSSEFDGSKVRSSMVRKLTPNSELTDSQTPNSKLTNSELTNSQTPNSELTDSQTPNSKLTNSELTDSQTPNSKLTNSELANSEPRVYSGQEPWSFGEKWGDLAKKAIELRYCLLPCLYTALWHHTLDGSPVLRHLAFADASDPKLWEVERDFLFGEHLLVSPVVQPKVQRQGVYLPKGNWYYFWTGQLASGEVFVNVMPEQVPFFVREGAVLPVYPTRQHTGEPVDELTLYVYYKNGLETSHLYEDAGEGYAYKSGGFSLKIFETAGKNGAFTLRQRKEGDHSPGYSKVKIYLVGFPAFVKKCAVDGTELPIKEIRLRDRSLYTLSIRPDFETIEWNS
jgi:hypothetical protein